MSTDLPDPVDSPRPDPLDGLTLREASRLIRASKQVHNVWYRDTYPDVAALGMEPAEHYLKYGADMGRNPGKNFNTQYYTESYPEVAESGINPLLYFVRYGEAAHHTRKRPPRAATRDGLLDVSAASQKMLKLGFEAAALEEIAAIARDSEVSTVRVGALRELLAHRMRRADAEGHAAALPLFEAIRAEDPALATRRLLAPLEVLCHCLSGDPEQAEAVYQRAVMNGETSPHLRLAAVNIATTPADRMTRIDGVLAAHDLSPLTLLATGATVYDRLAPAAPPEPVTDGPLISVLIATYDAADTLPTALRGLQQQSWRNLEIIVIDDASDDDGATAAIVEAAAASDPRIRFIPMARNGGAYVARNAGLDAATGDYVTVHDADDWSHPEKIATQARYLMAHPDVMGCTSQQARCTSDLAFTRWSGVGYLLFTNTSSFMFRRAPMRERLGYWDTVRFSADNELVRRFQIIWGEDAIVHLPTGPLSFQRDSDTSMVADPELGINGQPFGVRRQYIEAQKDHHTRGEEGLLYRNDPATRPFPAPRIMTTGRAGYPERNHYDVIITSDFRLFGGSSQSNAQEIDAQARGGLRTGIFPMYRYDVSHNIDRAIVDEVWNEVRGGAADILSHGETVSCDLLIVRYPPVLYRYTPFIPKVTAGDVRVVVNQPPQGDYTEEGQIRYELEHCAHNLRRYFGRDATWHPIGPLVRDAMTTHHAHELQHITLSDWDWSNIIDIAGWSRGPRTRGPSDRMRIGRHSRDHPHKWPSDAAEIRAAYPDAPDVEVHVLGGARVPDRLTGGRPDNWVVHEFGSMAPRDFLADIDVFVYFSHPGWVESFGRTIIEAMAVGVPVILPEIYRPLFRDAAIYATPETAVDRARALHADPAAYAAQVARATDYAARNFSYDTHLRRVDDIRRAVHVNT
ncbi:glycosyltransferase [Jannaschia sp. 2305UL9-9]|uniref:glycosyltransferase n=1 Tax=Jannaschia sp. 2305UL9-9 TaxID=3121638 RepID=UPI0035297D33